MPDCIYEGCDKERYARDLCRRHYQRAKNAGEFELMEGRGRPRREVTGGEEWADRPERTKGEVTALMVKRAYELLNDPKTPKDAVLTVMRIVGRWESKVEEPGILEELKKMQGEVRGVA